MRGDSGFAEKNVRVPADLLQRDSLKVVNLAELARELTGDVEPSSPLNAEKPVDPTEYWKRHFKSFRGTTPLVVTVPPQNMAARKPAQLSFTPGKNVSERLRVFADQIGVPIGVLFQASWALLLHRYC